MRRPLSPGLPLPDAAGEAQSARVVASLRERLEAGGGWIPFADYMQHVLYAPGLGYYAAGARKLGAEGDFTTAPEMTPLFGQALAAPVAAILHASGVRTVLEFGAGSGALARDVLRALPDVRYRILEVSPDLRERQRTTLLPFASRVEWLDRLPDAVEGVVLMNEVLDAVPPHVIARRGGEWLERGVAWDGALCWSDRPLQEGALRRLATARFPATGDYTSEINPAAEALVRSVAMRVRRGALVVIDYGFPRAEYYHPQRSAGTLMGHYRHRAHDDPFLWPGLSDLTAHVDFTAVAEAGVAGGLRVAAYTSLAAFLVGAGILEDLAQVGEPTSQAYLREAAAVQRLLSPAEMGELFKVIVLTEKGDGIVWPYLQEADRSHRL
ncbi:MAG: SAM-dependent methyltransferase [Burkholderiales bacterium]